MSQFINLNTIIGNGKMYRVPIYQRDYSWKTNEEVEDLWNDILDLEIDQKHYMGYLVLLPEQNNSDSFWIIDGQQRLITLSLLALSVIKLLRDWANADIDKLANEARVKEELRRYIGNVDTSSDITHGNFLPILPKLTLNRNNDDYYKSYLMQFREAAVLNKQKPSIRLMQKAFNFFYDRLSKRFEHDKSGAKLTQFLEKTVGNGLVFTVIEVQNDIDAYKVFETLNARGVKLSPADLLKNYLFSQAAKRGQLDLDEAERIWLHISEILGKKDITTFIRYYWNSKYKLTKQAALFKSIKTTILNAEDTFSLLRELELNAEYYAGFDNPGDTELWKKEERKHLQVLDLLEVSTCYPLMLAFIANLPREDFHILLREIASLSIRYSIAQYNPNDAEVVYSNVANQVYAGKLNDVKSVALALKSIYVTDANFESAFSGAVVNTRRKKNLVKYILTKLENQISSTDYQFEDSAATIEHILPENPGTIWERYFSLDIQDDYKYRLGNYTLLPAADNRKLDNETPFSEKKAHYINTRYKLSSEYCNYDDFTPSTLEQRQERMAKIAKAVWKSAFL